MDHVVDQQEPVLPVSSPPSSVQKPQKTLAVIFILIVLGILGVGTAWAYKKYMDPPEKKIAKAFEKMAEANSFSYEGSLVFTAALNSDYGQYINMAMPAADDKKIQAMEISFSGTQERKASAQSNSLFSFLVKFPSEDSVAVGLETRSVGGKLYAKVMDETKVPFFDISSFKNRWVKLDLASYIEQFGLKTIQPATSTAAGNKETLNDIKNKKIKEMVENAHILKVNKVSTKKIDGVSFAVYDITIEKEKAKQLFLDIAVFEDAKISEKELTSFNQALDEIKEISGEILIGKKDGLPHQIHLDVIKNEKEKGSINLAFKDFDKPIVVAEPENYISVEELIGEVFGGLEASYPTSSFKADLDFEASLQTGAQIDTDKDGLVDSLEKAYGTNPLKADTDGDGFKDYEEVLHGYNPKGPGNMPSNLK
jgi:hypothetical protein